MTSDIQNLGLISRCDTRSSDCHYRCCVFTDNYIVLYPGEYEKTDKDKNHLIITDNNYFGGKKAVCTRRCTETSFKPLDCQSYPYFPRINKEGKIEIIVGKKCPLIKGELETHRTNVIGAWSLLIKNEGILEWLKKVELVGYEPE
jgi:hypothetical protein